jgi:hypothetical protein
MNTDLQTESQNENLLAAKELTDRMESPRRAARLPQRRTRWLTERIASRASPREAPIHVMKTQVRFGSAKNS